MARRRAAAGLRERAQEARDAIAVGLFEAWWRPFLRYGVIHGDPHLGNYAVAASGKGDRRKVEGINLFDYGCVRIFPTRFVAGWSSSIWR